MSQSTCPTEEELVELVTGVLQPARAAELDAHVKGCASCHAAVTALSTRSNDSAAPVGQAAPLPAAGDRVGRFIVLEWVGGGAMGKVCAAYDTTLHRKVALKFLTSTLGTGWSRAHVEREARALARVAHPNVVTMFDVGTHGETPFLAMEFIDGVNLRQWLQSERRSLSEIRDAFAQAAQGLLAAHRAGILHRDFKPENLLVGRDGRVRVSDFGLAAEGALVDVPPAVTDALLGVQPLSSRAVTIAAVGTPAYMAPELWSKEKPTAQADVFAFSVALYEALCGRRPFPDGPAERLVAIKAGAPAVTAAVERPLREAIAKGLAAKPEARPSIEELALALRAPRRRLALAWAAVPLALLAAGGWRVIETRARAEACSESSRASSALTSAPVLDALRARFAVALGEGQGTVFEGLKHQLESFDVRWSAQRRTACLESADPVQRSRAACLDRKLDQVLALEAVLKEASARAAGASAKAVDTLGDLSECARTAVPLVPAAAVPRELVSQLDQLNAVFETGDYQRAYELAGPLEAQSRQVSNDGFVAQVLRATGRAHNAHGGNEEARQRFAESAELAVKASDANSEARALMLLAAVTAIDMGRLDEGLLILRMSRVAQKRAELPLEIEARTSLVEGRMLVSGGRPVPAVAAFARALEIWTGAAVPPRYDLVRLRGEMASALHGVGRREEAVAMLHAAISESEPLLGAKHPLVGSWLHNQGLLHFDLGELEPARDSFKRALEIHAPQGPSRCHFLETQSMLATVEGLLGAADAKAQLQRTRAEMVSAECGVSVIEGSWLSQATLETAKAEHKEALTSVEMAAQVVSAARATPSLEAPRLKARALEGLGRTAEAKAAWEQALAELTQQRGERHPDVAVCLTHLARLEQATGGFVEALALMDRALALGDAGRSRAESAATRFLHAQLLEHGSDEGATAEARKALELAKGTPLQAEIEKWLSAR